MTLQLNDRFTEPQKIREVERTAKDAYKDAITFFDAYVKNDFEMQGLPRNLIKPMKNTTVMDKLNLNLTQDEIEHLTTLISKGEKQRRDTVKKREQRGSVTRDTYLEISAEQTDKQLARLRELVNRNPKEKKARLAKELGVSRNHLYRMLRKLDKKV
ncbi:AsnC family protein, partial [Bacillus cereus]